jgi:hypothetical protein
MPKDVDAAVEAWQRWAPPEFKNLLEAGPESEPEE